MIQWFSPCKHFDPADYELWFENLALQGYHPHIAPYSFIAMRFEKSAPKQYKYVVDLQAFPKSDYIATYQSFGWQLVGQIASMFIWRKEYADEKPEAFSDRDSLLKRNARIAKAMTFSTIAAFITSVLFWIGFVATLPENHLSTTLCMGIFGGIAFFAGVLLLYLSIRILTSQKIASDSERR